MLKAGSTGERKAHPSKIHYLDRGHHGVITGYDSKLVLYRIPRELGKPVLLDVPLQIKHIAFARLMVRFIKCGSRFRLPGCRL